MKRISRVKVKHSTNRSAVSPQTALAILEEFAALPWIEAALSLMAGTFMLAIQMKELAGVTVVVGVALSFTRYAFTKKLEEEMTTVHRLASVLDLQNQVSLNQFQEMIRIYLQITETEFLQVKDTIIIETIERLQLLAQQKTSDKLPTGAYYNLLLPLVEFAAPGSSIWAVSMMLEAEWDGSPVEESFLRLSLDAARRGVHVERIFVVRRELIPNLYSNKGVKEHLENAGEFLKPLLVERDYLGNRDPQLLKQLGDGLIAFDMRIALIDASSPEGLYGYATMNQGEIARRRRVFENLRVHTRHLTEVIKAL